ncbi:hypothetical protein LJB87_03025, partial [Alistipes sp. OttesenSCG-928-L06]|nr:hypothetical protein [Alistipes sp. OttesenSCG-928-L06]
AKMWKNGVVTNLTDGTTSAFTESIFVDGDDIYVAGRINRVATLWKNGVAQALSNETNSAALSVLVSQGDVYIAGYEGSYNSVLWKNGEHIPLPDGRTAKSVFVYDNDVYVTGNGMIGRESTVLLWKNGVPTPIPGGSDGYGVFVVPKP